MHVFDYNKTNFLKSFSNIIDIPHYYGIEIALIGYSNAGKSSIINSLTNQKKLARFSKMPGRTQLINFFEVSSKFRIVDLPGYGYSNAPEAVKLKWQKTLYDYLEKRDLLQGIVLVMDIRHPLKILDYKILNLIIQKKYFLIIVLNKCDKLTISKQKIQFDIVQKKIRSIIDTFQIVIFSSTHGIGTNTLRKILNIWYNKIYYSN
ncbi:ribosome biogenesis GTP-binding protein YihA/YsxC [Buchnera aphidicola]|uniref:ribosome biogenesis GTP-binding protein YihA/YsxC n=1 Tax=Buchnera aphidicola TaxID=9 RepID=UPI003BEEEBF7